MLSAGKTRSNGCCFGCGLLLHVSIAITLLVGWCSSTCTQPGGNNIRVNWTLSAAESGSLQSQILVSPSNIIFFCCPMSTSSFVAVATQAEFNSCNSSDALNNREIFSCENTGQVTIPLNGPIHGKVFLVNNTYYFISRNETECNAGLRIIMSVFKDGQVPTIMPSTSSTSASTSTSSTGTPGGGTGGGTGGGGSGGGGTGNNNSTDLPTTDGVATPNLLFGLFEVPVFAGIVVGAVFAVVFVCGVMCAIIVCVFVCKKKHKVGTNGDVIQLTTHTPSKQNRGCSVVSSFSSAEETDCNTVENNGYSPAGKEISVPQQQNRDPSPLKSPSRPPPPRPPNSTAPAAGKQSLSSLPVNSNKLAPINKPLKSLPVQGRVPASPSRRPPPPPTSNNNKPVHKDTRPKPRTAGRSAPPPPPHP